MNVSYSRSFKKNYKKLGLKVRKKFDERLAIFQEYPFHPILNNHSVHYPYDGCRSINITGDIRALYEPKDDMAYFLAVGSHSELYK